MSIGVEWLNAYSSTTLAGLPSEMIVYFSCEVLTCFRFVAASVDWSQYVFSSFCKFYRRLEFYETLILAAAENQKAKHFSVFVII